MPSSDELSEDGEAVMSAHRDAGEAAAAAAAAAGRLPRLEGKLRWLLPLTTTKDFFKDCKVCDAHTGEAITGLKGGSKVGGLRREYS
jgi:hypothetical protein